MRFVERQVDACDERRDEDKPRQQWMQVTSPRVVTLVRGQDERVDRDEVGLGSVERAPFVDDIETRHTPMTDAPSGLAVLVA